jgi:hypothetical protein
MAASTSKERTRATIIVIGFLLMMVAIAQYFGWVSQAPPLLAPGIQ